MKAIALTLLGILTALVIVSILGSLTPERQPTYEEIQAAQRWSNVWFIGGSMLILGIPALLLGAGVVAIARFRRLARPDAAGRLPVLLSDAGTYQSTAVAALSDFHATEHQRASVQPVPHSISVTQSPHFAPRLDYRHERLAGELADEPLLSLAAGLVPSFSELLNTGKVGHGRPLLLGVNQDTGEDVQGSWLDLYSTIVSGLPGSGKTTSQRFLACQTALQGARFVIVDPHAGAADDSLAATLAPLRSAFLCQPASDDHAILSAVQLVADIGKRRKDGLEARSYPVILWLDETTALLSRSKVAGPLAELVEMIAQEYRKVGVFACASGQIWSASRTGDDSALRDSFASVICHRMKRSQARLLVPTDEAQRVERLGTGQALLWRTSGETTVIGVPNTTAQDVQRVAGLLTDNAPTLANLLATPVANVTPESSRKVAEMVADVTPESSQVEVNASRLHSAAQSGMPVSPEAARAAAMFLSGANIADVVKELRGITSSGGARYQKALNEVQALIRAGIAAQ